MSLNKPDKCSLGFSKDVKVDVSLINEASKKASFANVNAGFEPKLGKRYMSECKASIIS